MARTINAAGLALIESFESFRAAPYLDQRGIPTIGFGHTHNVRMTDPVCTIAQAEQWLQEDVQNFCDIVERLVKVPLADNQFSALVCLIYNTGSGPLRMTLGEKLNAGDYAGAAEQFLRWDKIVVDGHAEVCDGLAKRRKAEACLFLSADNP